MNFGILTILSLLFAGAGIVSTFVPRFPAVLASYASLVLMHFAGAPYVSVNLLIFWGVAVLMVLGLKILQPKVFSKMHQGHSYVAGGCLSGTVLGFLAAPTAAAIILGGAIGAFLGALAFMRTPQGPKFSVTSKHFIDYLCAKGLPSVVSCSMAAIVIACIL